MGGGRRERNNFLWLCQCHGPGMGLGAAARAQPCCGGDAPVAVSPQEGTETQGRPWGPCVWPPWVPWDAACLGPGWGRAMGTGRGDRCDIQPWHREQGEVRGDRPRGASTMGSHGEWAWGPGEARCGDQLQGPP